MRSSLSRDSASPCSNGIGAMVSCVRVDSNLSPGLKMTELAWCLEATGGKPLSRPELLSLTLGLRYWRALSVKALSVGFRRNFDF